MINSFCALGCRIRIIHVYLVSEPHTLVRPAASPCMSSSTRYNPYPTPAYLITNNKYAGRHHKDKQKTSHTVQHWAWAIR